MASLEKASEACEVENQAAKGTIEYERAQMLAGLPDPDAGKTDEERREIVRYLLLTYPHPMLEFLNH